MKRILILLYVSTFWSACHLMKPSVKLPGFAAKTYKLTSTIGAKDSADASYFVYNYLEFSDPVIQDFVMKRIVLDSGKNSVDEMGRDFIAEFEKYAKTSPHVNPWFEERNLSVRLQTPSYISFQQDWSNYTGGAHGMYSTVFFNYNVGKGKEIFLHDLLEPTRRADLTRLGEELFRKQEGLNANDALEPAYFFEDGKFYLNDNYTLTEDGLLFLYNIYEIKPYVAGQTKLLIPYRALEPLLNETGRNLVAEIRRYAGSTSTSSR